MKNQINYIDGLLHVINPLDGKIHSSFNQTVTATGRISTEPNLRTYRSEWKWAEESESIYGQ